MSPMPILTRNRKHAALATSDQGFVSLYFLVLFLLCVTLTAIILDNTQNQLRTMINIRKANELHGQEASVLSFLKCEVKNERLEEGSYEENGVSFGITLTNNGATVSIFAPYPEVLQIEVNEHEHTVYDYHVIRSETPA